MLSHDGDLEAEKTFRNNTAHPADGFLIKSAVKNSRIGQYFPNETSFLIRFMHIRDHSISHFSIRSYRTEVHPYTHLNIDDLSAFPSHLFS